MLLLRLHATLQGTVHVFRLMMNDKQEDLPPHLAAAALKDAERSDFKPVKLNAIGRARAAASLGSLPGSAAASAAVGLYSGNHGFYSEPPGGTAH